MVLDKEIFTSGVACCLECVSLVSKGYLYFLSLGMVIRCGTQQNAVDRWYSQHGLYPVWNSTWNLGTFEQCTRDVGNMLKVIGLGDS